MRRLEGIRIQVYETYDRTQFKEGYFQGHVSRNFSRSRWIGVLIICSSYIQNGIFLIIQIQPWSYFLGEVQSPHGATRKLRLGWSTTLPPCAFFNGTYYLARESNSLGPGSVFPSSWTWYCSGGGYVQAGCILFGWTAGEGIPLYPNGVGIN